MDDVDEVVRLYRGVLNRAVVGLSSSERNYISALGYIAGRRAALRLKDTDTSSGT
jgi:hypothetical protein